MADISTYCSMFGWVWLVKSEATELLRESNLFECGEGPDHGQ
jgi:hypothetical protein